MNYERVVITWVWRGLSDLICAFSLERNVFWDQARFLEVMALEKFLKAVILLAESDSYESLPVEEARSCINSIAMGFNHKIEKMLNTVDGHIGGDKVAQAILGDYSDYSGREMIRVIQSGYLEYRYPVAVPIYKSFPLGDNCFKDPLGSSAITEFAYRICNISFFHLQKNVAFDGILEHFERRYGELDAFGKFNNLFWSYENHNPFKYQLRK